MHSGDLGDHIGMESCVDLGTETESALSSGGGYRSENRKRWGVSTRSSRLSGKKAKELPPPLPIQTSTVMKRYYTEDGRLVITEEKVESPNYHFTAHRSHGRLTIQLVRSDDEDNFPSCENGEENGIMEEEDECSGKVAMGGGGGGDDGGSRVLGKCFSYNAAVVRAPATGSCLLVNQNQLHAMTPVQI
ncbi:unnamed protein product [Lactuca virosa]|uniref:FAF domain-containing protein n=1 Tax=Lactuca virosa TaxID=75947 RepID=A0AAU9P822_9ASTR|nr:unnamed protein product [Lactuca virosa]